MAMLWPCKSESGVQVLDEACMKEKKVNLNWRIDYRDGILCEIFDCPECGGEINASLESVNHFKRTKREYTFHCRECGQKYLQKWKDVTYKCQLL